MTLLLISIFSDSLSVEYDTINLLFHILMPILSAMVLSEDDYIRSSLVNIYFKLSELPFQSAAFLSILYRDLSELVVDRAIPTSVRNLMIFSLGNILNGLLNANVERFAAIVSQSLSKQILDASLPQAMISDELPVVDDFFEPSEESFFEGKSSSFSTATPSVSKANHILPTKKSYSSGMTGLFLLLLEDQEVEIREATLHVIFSLLGRSNIPSIDTMILSTIGDLLCDESPMIIQLILDALREKKSNSPLPLRTISSISMLLQAVGLAQNVRLICHDLLRKWRLQDTASLDSAVVNLLFCMEKEIDPASFILETACHIGDLNFEIIKETAVWTKLLQVSPVYLAVEPSLLDPYCIMHFSHLGRSLCCHFSP